MCSPAYTSSGYWQGGLKIPQDWRMHARVKGGYPPTCAGPLMWRKKQVKVWPTYYGGRDAKYRKLFKWSLDQILLCPHPKQCLIRKHSCNPACLFIQCTRRVGWIYIWFNSNPKLMKLVWIVCLSGRWIVCSAKWTVVVHIGVQNGTTSGKLFETPDERCRGGEIGSTWSNYWADSQLEQLQR